MITLMSILLKLFMVVVILGVLSTIGFTAYYFYVFQPQKMEFISAKGEEQKACLADKDNRYNEFWDRECRGLGFRERCRLPAETLQRLDQTLSDDKNACSKNYEEALKTINYVFPWDKK